MKKKLKTIKAKKPARKILKEAIIKSKRRTIVKPIIKKIETKKYDVLIKSIDLSKYNFERKPVYRRRGNFILDCENFQIALIKCSNNIDFNVEIFDKSSEDDGIFIKTIRKEKDLVIILKALLENHKKSK